MPTRQIKPGVPSTSLPGQLNQGPSPQSVPARTRQRLDAIRERREGLEQWYAIHTRCHHEKQVAALLEKQQIETYLPVRRTWSNRRDRRVALEVPALPGYLFVRCVLYPEVRALIKRSSSVVYLVENAGRPAAIPEKQVQSLRLALEHGDTEGHPYLQVGQRVRVTCGPMLGVEGYLTRVAEKKHRLVLLVDHVNQALSMEIDAACVEPC